MREDQRLLESYCGGLIEKHEDEVAAAIRGVKVDAGGECFVQGRPGRQAACTQISAGTVATVLPCLCCAPGSTAGDDRAAHLGGAPALQAFRTTSATSSASSAPPRSRRSGKRPKRQLLRRRLQLPLAAQMTLRQRLQGQARQLPRQQVMSFEAQPRAPSFAGIRFVSIPALLCTTLDQRERATGSCKSGLQAARSAEVRWNRHHGKIVHGSFTMQRSAKMP